MQTMTTDPDAPAPIKAAVLLAVGDLYENREGQADRQLFSNPTYALKVRQKCGRSG